MQTNVIVLRLSNHREVAFLPKEFRFIYCQTEVKSRVQFASIDIENSTNIINTRAFSEITKDNPLNLDTIHINSTNACNAKCTYCYNKSNHGSNKVAFSQVEKALKGYDTSKVTSFTLLGGEPLLNLNLVYDLILKTDKVINLSTGLVVSEKTLESFLYLQAKYPERIHVQISLDPSDSYRGTTKEDKLKVVRVLKAVDPSRIRLRSTLCKDSWNYVELRDSYEDILGRDVDVDFEICTIPEFEPTPKEIYQVLELILDDIDNNLGKAPLSIDTLTKNLFEHRNGNFILANGCGMTNGTCLNISENGLITTCCMPVNLENISLDNCRDCAILRYCGIACKAQASTSSLCKTQLLKVAGCGYNLIRNYGIIPEGN